MQRKLIIFYALLCASAFLFVSGPSYVFGLYDNEKALNKTLIPNSKTITEGSIYVFKL